MADSAIRAAGGANAPLSYLVPGAAVIRIKLIHVKYVDNGAAGDWLPAVRIVDDAGHTMGTAADQGVKVTAGDDADVSFFPGVKHAPTGGGGGFDFKWCHVVTNSSVPVTNAMPIVSFDTNTPLEYIQLTASTWQIPQFPQVLVGWLLPAAGSPYTTTGTIFGRIISGAGGFTEAFAASGVDVVLLPLVYGLIDAFSLSNPWRTSVLGTDAGGWAMHAWFFRQGN